MEVLNTKKEQLAALDSKLAGLQRALENNTMKKRNLEDEYENTEKKLIRATKLMAGLGGEKTRYTETSARLAKAATHILGDVLLSAGIIAYLGPFTGVFRRSILDQWKAMCLDNSIPMAENYSLIEFLGDAVKVQVCGGACGTTWAPQGEAVFEGTSRSAF